MGSHNGEPGLRLPAHGRPLRSRAREREYRRGYADGWIAAVEELTAVLAGADRAHPPAAVRAAYAAAWAFRTGPLAAWAAGDGTGMERAPWLAEPWRPPLRPLRDREP